MKAKDYIKLGTALRYLIDVHAGEPLGGKHVLQNIETVLQLMQILRFQLTLNSASVANLKVLHGKLRTENVRLTSISTADANELERLCRKIRDSLLTEGDGMALVLDPGNRAPSLSVPEAITPHWLFKHVPVPLWLAFCGALIAAYSLGVETSDFARSILNQETANEPKPELKPTEAPTQQNRFPSGLP